MAEWLKWTLGISIIVVAVGISIATAGLATPISASLGGGLFGAIVGGAAAGAIGGAVAGFGISVGMQGISNDFNIDFGEAGKSALTGAISGAIAGGAFGGIRHLTSVNKAANSISGLSKAQSNLDKALSPLKNVKSLSGTFSSGTNIARTVGQAASNYNSAYIAFANAQIVHIIAKSALELALYSGGQFLLKQAIGYGMNMVW